MKIKYIFLLFLSLFLIGCDQEEEFGSFILNDDDGSITIEGEIGEYVMLPEKLKDDYIFLGWSDGDNYYLGKSLVTEESLSLTAEYEPIENLFDKVYVSLGQVTLGEYLGDYKILAIPEYWHGYPIVGMQDSEMTKTIEKLYLPTNFYRRYSLTNYMNLKELVFYGDLNLRDQKVFTEGELLQYQNECPSLDLSSFDDVNPQIFDDCPLEYIKRNDDDAVYVPGEGRLFYTYDVVYQVEENQINSYGLWLPKTLEYLDIPYLNGYDNIGSPLKNLDLEKIGTNNEVEESDGFYYYINEMADSEKVLIFVDSEEDVLTIDASQYHISSNLAVSPNVKEINVINDDEEKYAVIDGVLYYSNKITQDTSSYEQLGLMLIPPAYGHTYEMPDNVVDIVNSQYDQIKEVKINNEYAYINLLLRRFPNLERILVDDDHPGYSLEDGILYSKDQTSVVFFNNSSDIKNIVLKDTVESFMAYSYLPYARHYSAIESVHLGENFSGKLDLMYGLENLESISVDENNQNYMVEDGVLMTKDQSTILFFDKSVRSLTIKSDDTSIYSSRFFNNISEITIEAQGFIKNLSALKGFDKLESIVVDEDNPYYQFKDGVLYSKDGKSLEFIVKGANLKSLEIDEIVEDVNLMNIRDYPYLEEIIVSEDNAYFESVDGVLYNKNLYHLLLYPLARQSNHLELPETVATISHLPQVIESIYIGKDYEFTYFESFDGFMDVRKDIVLGNFDQFESVEVNSENRYYHLDGFIGSVNKDIIFQVLPSTTELTIDSSIFKIRRDAFSNADQLESISIGPGVSTFPYGVLELENLQNITLLGDEVIDVQSHLYSSYDIDQWIEYVYYFDWHSLENIYVNDDLVNAYKNDEFWSLYEEIIKTQ